MPTRKSSKKARVLPQRFKSIEEAAEFWDTHDLTDYWHLTREAKFKVDIQRRVSTETLINVWLAEKLATTT